MSPHVVLCWEQGTSLGHVAALGQLAESLIARGVRVSAILQRLHDAERWFPRDVELFAAPTARTVASVRTPDAGATYADLLLLMGFGAPDTLRPVVRAWRTLFTLLRPDGLVFNMAPTACLAAWGMPVRRAQLGSPWTVPPDSTPWPPLQWWSGETPERALAVDGDLTRFANEARPEGTPALSCASDLYRGHRALLLGPPALDPWRLLRTDPPVHLGTMAVLDRGAEVDWPDGTGPRAVGYLKGSYPHNQRLLSALERRGVRTVVHVAGRGPPLTVRSALTRVAPEPVRLDRLLARADLGFTHSALTTGCALLERGIPTMVLPMQQEQLATARTATATLRGMMALPAPAVVEQLERALDIALGEDFRAAAKTQGAALASEDRAIDRATTAMIELLERPAGA